MKVVLGILLLANAALLLWGLGQREFMHDKHSPAAEFHPELMELVPPTSHNTLAKVTIETNGGVVTSNTGQDQRVPGLSDSLTIIKSYHLSLP